MKTIETEKQNEGNSSKKVEAMKAKNNVQKTILRTGAVIMSFVLISFTVSAQGFWERLLRNSSFNEIANAMIETADGTEKSVDTGSDSENINFSEVEKELALEVESWMIDDSLFTKSLVNTSEIYENNEGLKSWDTMIIEMNEKVDLEQQLQVEDWMTSGKLWNN